MIKSLKEEQMSVQVTTKKIIKEWTQNSETINKKVTVYTANGKVSGVAKKIDSDGSLQIKTKYGIERIFVGDVTTN